MEQDDDISLPWSQVTIQTNTGETDVETPDSRVQLRFPDGRTRSIASTPLTRTTTETVTPSTIGTISSIGSNRSLGTINEHLFVNPPVTATPVPAPVQTPTQPSTQSQGNPIPSRRLDFDN